MAVKRIEWQRVCSQVVLVWPCIHGGRFKFPILSAVICGDPSDTRAMNIFFVVPSTYLPIFVSHQYQKNDQTISRRSTSCPLQDEGREP
jgi:hypothetical protein